MNGEGEYCPGEWCTFCRAAVRCRARAEEKLKLAQEEFKRPPLLTDEEIEEILKVIPDLTKWANEIMAYATESAKIITPFAERNPFGKRGYFYASLFISSCRKTASRRSVCSVLS